MFQISNFGEHEKITNVTRIPFRQDLNLTLSFLTAALCPFLSSPVQVRFNPCLLQRVKEVGWNGQFFIWLKFLNFLAFSKSNFLFLHFLTFNQYNFWFFWAVRYLECGFLTDGHLRRRRARANQYSTQLFQKFDLIRITRGLSRLQCVNIKN